LERVVARLRVREERGRREELREKRMHCAQSEVRAPRVGSARRESIVLILRDQNVLSRFRCRFSGICFLSNDV
jgi:hypothetical protein